VSDRKARAIGGFPEFSPSIRATELHWIDTIRSVFESYGYCNIETPAVEELATLRAKGDDADREIYQLTRPGREESLDSRLGLHFDLTVPLARYVALHYNSILFPFKRYQIQRVWRGERPQEGRFREFTQCDIDVIGHESLANEFEVELLEAAIDALSHLGIGDVSFQLSNRKILEGFLRCLGTENAEGCVRVIDKISKIGIEGASRELHRNGLNPQQIDRCIRFATTTAEIDSFHKLTDALGYGSELIDSGMRELEETMRRLSPFAPSGVSISADFSIARGLNYYTGTIFEGRLTEYPEFPTICAGGRYENLLETFARRPLPGVGISIGLTRLFTKAIAVGWAVPLRPSPTELMLTIDDESNADRLRELARDFRRRGINAEVCFGSPILERQLRYADRRGIPYVWLYCSRTATHRVRDMNDSSEKAGDPTTWKPERKHSHRAASF
jgi:histidyl-tRNA synthetase